MGGSPMSRMGIVATYTLQEVRRDRLFWGLLPLMLFVIALAFFMRETSIVAGAEAFNRSYIALTSLAASVFIVLLVVSSMYREIDSKAIFMVITKPIARPEYILGKFIAFSLISAGIIVISFSGALMLGVGTAKPLAVHYILCLFEQLIMIMAALAITLGLRSLPSSILGVAGFYIIGHSTKKMVDIGMHMASAWVPALKVFYYLFPSLGLFSAQAAVLEHGPVFWTDILFPAGYAVVYLAILFLIIVIDIRKRDF
jgi:ABC-type transport system involved in multi-copper enzyme maturation permease subunit